MGWMDRSNEKQKLWKSPIKFGLSQKHSKAYASVDVVFHFAYSWRTHCVG